MSTYDSVTIDLDNGLISSAIALGFFAVLKFWNYRSSSSALCKLRNARAISVSGLRDLLSSSTEKNQLVVVRGFVQAGPKRWFSFQPNILESSTASGKIQGVVLLTTQARSVRHVWKGPSMGCTSYLGGVSTSFTKVPLFLLAERKGSDSSSDCVTVNLSALNYDNLPLTTIFDRLSSLNAMCLTLPLPVKSFLGHVYPFGLCLREKFLPLNFARNHPGLLEEKILPLGKEISVVGIGTLNYGNVEIKPCDELPYFLSDLTKDQMIVELSHKTNYLLLSAIFLGSLSLGAIVFALMIGCQSLEEKMQQRRLVGERRLAEERRQVEQRRLAEERRQVEQRRLAEERRQVEQRRLAEERRQVEQRRLAEERRQVEQRRLAEERRQVEQRRLAEGRRQAEERRRQDEERRLAEERRRQAEERRHVQQPMRNDVVEEGTKAIPEELLCVVCYAERRGSAFFPCGHVVCCWTCASKVVARDRKCPICRQHIVKFMKVYT